VIGVRDARLARGTEETVTEPEPVTADTGSAPASDTTEATASRNPARSVSRWLVSKN
jgi:hypothetical protein